LTRVVLVNLCWVFTPLACFGQQCTSGVIGYESGPSSQFATGAMLVSDLVLHDDGTGPGLIAAGKFAFAAKPAARVVRYRGGRWEDMEQGMPVGAFDAVRDLEVCDFSATGGPGLSIYAGSNQGPVYRWTGSQWLNTAHGQSGECRTLLAHTDENGPQLLAAGTFSAGVLGWRGNGAWSSVGSVPVNTTIYRLRRVDEGAGPEVFAVGKFVSGSTRGYMARLVSGALVTYPLPVFTGIISDITIYDEGTNGPELYLAGSFGAPLQSGVIRRRNGNWEQVGLPLTITDTQYGPSFFKIDEGSGEQLFVGGYIRQAGSYSGLVKLTPTGWQAPVFVYGGSGDSVGQINAVVRFQDPQGVRMYFGGSFSMFRTQESVSTEASGAHALFRSTPEGFEPTAEGIGPYFSNSTVGLRLSVLDFVDETRLFVGGTYGRVARQYALCGASFDGASWQPHSVPWSQRAAAWIESAVVARVDDEDRIVAEVQGSPLGPLAFWNGTQWVRMTFQPPASSGSGLIAIGDTAGNLVALTADGLYRLDGLSWVLVANCFNPRFGFVGDFGQGERFIFGASPASGGGPGLYESDGFGIARIGPATGNTVPFAAAFHDDGSGLKPYITWLGPTFIHRLENGAWQPVGSGMSWHHLPGTLVSFNDGQGPGLYAGAGHSVAGQTVANRVSRWRNGAWGPVVTPTLPNQIGPSSMAVFANSLYIAGDFGHFDAIATDRLARIDYCAPTCTPDFNNDGDTGTDQDIEAFFACLAGNCCPACGSADFNGDGDFGTDQDIEAFFRVLAGGPC
jgi:hypothetical protein